ncbi:MAG: glycosyltransferase [Chloroflexi bacterium]|nr:glycosyltransferase [Chloroflexota bacterium]
MTQWPSVSIIVPVFNGSRTIEHTLRTLLALDYPGGQYEIIIVDNNSQDDTPQKVQQYPVKLIYERQMQSSYAARNKGIKAARGDIVAFTDADCVIPSGWLRHLLAEHNDPQWGGFASGLDPYMPRTHVEQHLGQVGYLALYALQRPFFAPATIGERLFSHFTLTNYRSEISLPFDNLVSPPTANVAYRRQVFDTIGLFDVRLTSCGDLDLAWRAQTQTDWRINVAPQAAIYHQHRTSLPGLAKLYRKNGWGYGLVALKHAQNTARVARWMKLESLTLIALTTLKHLLILLTRLVRRPFRRADALYLRSPIFNLVANVNYYYGRLTAARKGNKWLSSYT